jgi:cytochrome c-type biogenesis protein CcmH/NrfG
VRVAVGGPTTPEHHGRLKQARELVASNQYADSLTHYQSLIDSSQLLEETRGDLRQLVDQNPADPRVRRLLGDTHMRLGDLQSALDTYRSALDQL